MILSRVATSFLRLASVQSRSICINACSTVTVALSFVFPSLPPVWPRASAVAATTRTATAKICFIYSSPLSSDKRRSLRSVGGYDVSSGLSSPSSLLAQRIRAGACKVKRAVCVEFIGAGPGTFDALVFSGTALNLPFAGERFRDVGGHGSFTRVVDLVSIVHRCVPADMEADGCFPYLLEFRIDTSFFRVAAVACGRRTGALPNPIAVTRHVAHVEFVFCRWFRAVPLCINLVLSHCCGPEHQ